MDASDDIPDSTDWLNTSLARLSSLENALHCQICKEFFDTPMITSCSHTFCSKCIRTALSTDGCCPACRSQDQASKLRNNWQLQEVVATFVEARPEVIKVARENQLAIVTTAQRPGKRKRVILDSDNSYPEEPTGRTTRSKSRRIVSSQTSQAEAIEIEDTDDETFSPEVRAPDDGLVECPLGCGQRMTIEQVEPHLDKCEDERAAREKAAMRPKNPPMSAQLQDRLNELNYSMMKERELSKKMKDLGIPGSGSKQLMIRRHTAWVNIWNANCDSSNPRGKKDLLHELDTWERTQGGNAPGTPSGIMKKDFDGNGWMKKNQNDFSRLIADARRTKVKAAVPKDEKDEPVPEVFTTSAPDTHTLVSPGAVTASPQIAFLDHPSANYLPLHEGHSDRQGSLHPQSQDVSDQMDQAHSDNPGQNPKLTPGQTTPIKKRMPMFALPADPVDSTV